MTKIDIVEKIHMKTGLTKKDCTDILEGFFDSLKTTLESGEKIKIAGFGNFEVKHKKDRKGRNPQTGEQITINARRIISFKPSTILKASINNVTL